MSLSWRWTTWSSCTTPIRPIRRAGRRPDSASRGTPPGRGRVRREPRDGAHGGLDAHPRIGEAVLVAGQGVVGLLITMLLRRVGATPIVTADLHERRRAASAAAGADHVLPVDVDLVDAVLELTDRRGVDVAVEAAGTSRASSLRRRGARSPEPSSSRRDTDSRSQPEPRCALPSSAPAYRQFAGIDARSGPRAALGSGPTCGPRFRLARGAAAERADHTPGPV